MAWQKHLRNGELIAVERARLSSQPPEVCRWRYRPFLVNGSLQWLGLTDYPA